MGVGKSITGGCSLTMLGISDNFNATTPPQLHSILLGGGGGAGFAYLSLIIVSWGGRKVDERREWEGEGRTYLPAFFETKKIIIEI